MVGHYQNSNEVDCHAELNFGFLEKITNDFPTIRIFIAPSSIPSHLLLQGVNLSKQHSDLICEN